MPLASILGRMPSLRVSSEAGRHRRSRAGGRPSSPPSRPVLSIPGSTMSRDRCLRQERVEKATPAAPEPTYETLRDSRDVWPKIGCRSSSNVQFVSSSSRSVLSLLEKSLLGT